MSPRPSFVKQLQDSDRQLRTARQQAFKPEAKDKSHDVGEDDDTSELQSQPQPSRDSRGEDINVFNASAARHDSSKLSVGEIKRPHNQKNLYRDRREMHQFYTFWAVLCIGGITILPGIVQVLVASLQLADVYEHEKILPQIEQISFLMRAHWVGWIVIVLFIITCLLSLIGPLVTATNQLPEIPLPLEKKRLRWQCSCGHFSYDDFFEIRPGALEEMETPLNISFFSKRNSPSFRKRIRDLRDSGHVCSCNICSTHQ